MDSTRDSLRTVSAKSSRGQDLSPADKGGCKGQSGKDGRVIQGNHSGPKSSRNSRSPKSRKGPYRFLRPLGRIVVLLAGILCVLIVAGILILRTSWAEKRLTAELPALLNPLLAEQGLYLEVDQLTGPLPNRLALTGLRLYDGFGLFLEIEHVETRLALGELLSGSLTMDIFQVVRPKLSRLPDIVPPTAPEEEHVAASPPFGLSLSLPIDVRLKSIAIEGATLPWTLLGLAPQGIDPDQGNQDNRANQNNLEESSHALADATPASPKASDPVPISPATASVPQPSATQSTPLPTALSGENAANMQKAWQQTLAANLHLNVNASAELSHGILHASLGLHARDTGHVQTSLGENFDLNLALTPIQLTLIEADHNVADVSGVLDFKLGEIHQRTNLALLAEINDTTARLTEFTLDGFGLSLNSSATVLLETGQPTAKLDLTSTSLDELILVLSAITGEVPGRLMSLVSPLALNLDISQSITSEVLNEATSDATFTNGHTNGRVSPHGQDTIIALHNAQVGSVSTKGKVTLGNIFPQSGSMLGNTSDKPMAHSLDSTRDNTSDNISGNTANTTARNGGNTERAPLINAPLTLNVDLTFQVGELHALSPDVQGAIQGTLKAEGSLSNFHDTAQSDSSLQNAVQRIALQSNLALTSSALATTSGDLHNFSANLVTSLNTQDQEEKLLRGSLKAQASPNELGPTDVNLAWDATIPPTDAMGVFTAPLTAQIQQLRVNIFGLTMAGGLKASLSPELLSPSSESDAPENSAEPSPSRAPNSQNSKNSPKNQNVDALVWPQGCLLDGHLEASVTDWAPLSLFAQTPLKGHNTSLAMSLTAAETAQTIKLTAQSDSFNAPAHGVMLDNLTLAASAFLPTQQGKLPALDLSLTTGHGEAADIPWRSITATIADEAGKGTFALNILEDQQKTLHKKATAAQQGQHGTGKTASTKAATAEASDRKNGSTASAGRQSTPMGTPSEAQFATKLQKGELLALSGQYSAQNMAVSLDTLTLKEPFSQTEIQLRQAADINFAEGLNLQGFTLDISTGGSLSAEVLQKGQTMEAKATITTLPLGFINDIAGTTLPPGHINADVAIQMNQQTNQQTPKGTMAFQLHLDKANRRTAATASQLPHQTGSLQTGLGNQQSAESLRAGPGESIRQGESIRSDESIRAGSGMNTDQADVHLLATIIQSGGRSYLSGSLDFSQLAKGGPQTQTSASYASAPSAPNQNPSAAPLTFRIPLSVAGGLPLPDVQGPFQANLQWHGPLDGFWQLVPLPDTEFSALASIDLGLSGTLASPKTGGTAYIAQGHLYDKGLGLLLTDMTLEAHASHNDEYRLIVAAQDGRKGSLGLEGALQLKDVPSLNLRGQLKHLAPLHRDDVKITLTGLLGANGPLNAPKVMADILVERGEIELLAAMGNGSVRTLPITDPNAVPQEADGSGGELDVTVTIPKRFYIRGLGLDSEWKGKLHINGGFAEPQIVGSLSPVRGYFELISKPFAFTGGEIVFAGGSKINPGLSLELTYTTSELEAIIKAGGNLEKPQLELQSKPPLPKDEVLAHVLFGKKISELSRFEALQLANSMSELAGISSGSLNPLTSMRKATGLDVLRFGSDDDNASQRQDSGMTGASNLGEGNRNGDSATESAPTLEAGKYINDSIYIGVEQGMTQESTGVRVEIELFPNTTIQGKSTATSSSAGIGWKMDY